METHTNNYLQMDTTKPGFYKRIKDNNFNISIEDYQEISKVLLNDIEKNKITEEEFNKILHILYLFDSDDETNKINSKEEFETKLIEIRKYTKYQPSLSKLVKVYRRDILWPEWGFSPNYNQNQNHYSEKPSNNNSNSNLDLSYEIINVQDYTNNKNKPIISKIPIEVYSINPFTNKQISKDLFSYIKIKNARGAYGVVNISILTPPFGNIINKDGEIEEHASCKNNCYFCPNPPKQGPYASARSYLLTEPVPARAALVGFNMVEQIRSRIRDLAINGHIERVFNPVKNSWTTIGKIDIRLVGGTFGHYSIENQDNFIQETYYAIRTIDILDQDMPPIMSLEDEIEYHISHNDGLRIVALSIETRPDLIDLPTIIRYNKYFITFVEMGVQTTNDKILKKVNRGHKTIHSEKALALLKSQAGFKILLHFMQDLPGATPETDIYSFQDHLSQKNIPYSVPFAHRADHLKIYPTLDLPYTEIRKWKEKGKWKPYSEEENGRKLQNVIYQIVKNLPSWIRIARIFRDFPEATEKNNFQGYESETMTGNLGQMINNMFIENDEMPDDIRTREVKRQIIDLSKIRLNTKFYYCSEGFEYFETLTAPSFEHNNEHLLVGLLRIRFNIYPSEIPEVDQAAIIRELHVYGTETAINTNKSYTDMSQPIYQHRGYGELLLSIGEYMAYNRRFKRIVVISASGTMNYYAKKGYNRCNKSRYMEKKLTFKNHLKNIIKIKAKLGLIHLFK